MPLEPLEHGGSNHLQPRRWLQHGINVLQHVLQQHGMSCLDGLFEHLHHPGIAHPRDLQVAVRFLATGQVLFAMKQWAMNITNVRQF